MLPEQSTTQVSTSGLRSFRSTTRALMPTLRRPWTGLAKRLGAYSRWMAKSPSSGAASSLGK